MAAAADLRVGELAARLDLRRRLLALEEGEGRLVILEGLEEGLEEGGLAEAGLADDHEVERLARRLAHRPAGGHAGHTRVRMRT